MFAVGPRLLMRPAFVTPPLEVPPLLLPPPPPPPPPLVPPSVDRLVPPVVVTVVCADAAELASNRAAPTSSEQARAFLDIQLIQRLMIHLSILF